MATYKAFIGNFASYLIFQLFYFFCDVRICAFAIFFFFFSRSRMMVSIDMFAKAFFIWSNVITYKAFIGNFSSFLIGQFFYFFFDITICTFSFLRRVIGIFTVFFMRSQILYDVKITVAYSAFKFSCIDMCSFYMAFKIGTISCRVLTVGAFERFCSYM